MASELESPVRSQCGLFDRLGRPPVTFCWADDPSFKAITTQVTADVEIVVVDTQKNLELL